MIMACQRSRDLFWMTTTMTKKGACRTLMKAEKSTLGRCSRPLPLAVKAEKLELLSTFRQQTPNPDHAAESNHQRKPKKLWPSRIISLVQSEARRLRKPKASLLHSKARKLRRLSLLLSKARRLRNKKPSLLLSKAWRLRNKKLSPLLSKARRLRSKDASLP